MAFSFFTEFTFFKGVLYSACAIYVLCAAVAVMLEPYMTLDCGNDDNNGGSDLTFPNVLYAHDPCRQSTRHLKLMGMTPQECTFGRHLVIAAVLGSIIGYERRSVDRPAGIRTMSLVSLAAALFTVNSTFVFEAGPMHWDPARVSAAIPSGVGFLGAGLIVKDIYKDTDGTATHTVKGLTTATSVWLSAAVGVACGGGLYFVATYTAALILVMLRFGPRHANEQMQSILPERYLPPSAMKDSVEIRSASQTEVMKRNGSPKPQKPSTYQC